MQEMKAGNFTEQEMNEAKDMIIHYLRETMDNNHGLVELFYQQKLANYERTLEEIITKDFCSDKRRSCSCWRKNPGRYAISPHFRRRELNDG